MTWKSQHNTTRRAFSLMKGEEKKNLQLFPLFKMQFFPDGKKRREFQSRQGCCSSGYSCGLQVPSSPKGGRILPRLNPPKCPVVKWQQVGKRIKVQFSLRWENIHVFFFPPGLQICGCKNPPGFSFVPRFFPADFCTARYTRP